MSILFCVFDNFLLTYMFPNDILDYRRYERMTENDRIRILRKELNLTLTQFSKKLGITHAALSNIENGKRNVTEQMRKSICREFNVDPIWLTTGEGDKYIDQSVESITILDKILHNESKLAQTMFKMFAQYTLEDWKDLERIVSKSAEYIKMLETKDESDDES